MDAKSKHRAEVWLEDGWERRLDEHRERGGELRRARQQAVRHREARLAFRDDAPADEQTSPLIGKERMEEIVEERRQEERERHAEEVAQEQREAERFMAEQVAAAPKPVRFGLLVEMWAEEHRATEQRATWTLRKALGRLGYSLRAHAETLGEMFVYPGESRPPDTVSGARPKANEVPKVDGIYQHGSECPCEWCEGSAPLRSVELGGTA